MARPSMTILSGATLIGPDGSLGEGSLILENDTIREVSTNPSAAALLNQDNVELITLSPDTVITPGLIDLQVNGAFGCNFGKTMIAEVLNVLALLPQYGLTSVYPTLISDFPEDTLSAINTLEEVVHFNQPGHCRIAGIHLEGPFLNPAYRGTHPSDVLDTASFETIKGLISPNVRLVTLAPEQDEDGLVTRYLTEQGIRVLAGHTGANLSELFQSKAAGIKGFTHLFNGMPTFHHRTPGIIVPALLDDELYATLIADGFHIHPNTIRLVMKTKPFEKLILVSDSIGLAGMNEGETLEFAHTEVTNHQGRAINKDGALAGSTMFLHQCVKNMVEWDIMPFDKAIQLATKHPAQLMGIEKTHGQLVAGARANLVFWNKNSLNIEQTWLEGQCIYRADAPLPHTPTELSKFTWQGS